MAGWRFGRSARESSPCPGFECPRERTQKHSQTMQDELGTTSEVVCLNVCTTLVMGGCVHVERVLQFLSANRLTMDFRYRGEGSFDHVSGDDVCLRMSLFSRLGTLGSGDRIGMWLLQRAEPSLAVDGLQQKRKGLRREN